MEINSIEKENKIKLFNFEMTDLSNLSLKIKNIYLEELYFNSCEILNIQQSEFIELILNKVKFVLEDLYTQICFEYDSFLALLNEVQEIIYNEYYLPVIDRTKKNIDFYSYIPRDQLPSFNKFIKHCFNCDDQAIHTCKNKLVPIFDNYREIKNLLCLECNHIYFLEYIKLWCNYCNKPFHSSYNDITQILQPATWQNYHCRMILNEQMNCIMCKSLFFYDVIKKILFCKQCLFEIDPSFINWICFNCKGEFRTGVKIYNPSEFKAIKLSIRDAIYNKNIVKPQDVLCCNINPYNYNFFHNLECKGLLYYGKLNKKILIVCGKCRTMTQLDLHYWNCPNCNKLFKNTQLIFNNQIPTSPENTNILSTNDVEYVCNTIEEVHEEIKGNPIVYAKKRDNRAFSIFKDKKSYNKEVLPRNSMSLIKSHQDFKFQKEKINHAIEPLNLKPQKIEDRVSKNLNSIFNDNKSPLKNQKSNKLLLSMNRSPSRDNHRQLRGRDSNVVNNDNFIKKINHPVNEPQRNNRYSNFINNSKKTISDLRPLKQLRDFNNSINLKSSHNDLSNSISLLNFEIPEFNVEDYNIVCQIGEGSFGKIYQVEDKYKNKYSMKKIFANNISELKSFCHEFEIANFLKHPNILQILGISKNKLDVTTYVLYILMEFAISDWDKEIKQRQLIKKYYTEKELLGILKQLVNALTFLQDNNISHRDIKPQNILIFFDKIYKIADFGEAKRLSIYDKDVLTMRGTEMYMSPLLFNGLRNNIEHTKHNTYKSDVFSLAFCLIYASSLDVNSIYQCRYITKNEKMYETLKNILSARYSMNYVYIISKMLDVDEMSRYDFYDLKKQLDNFQ